MIGPAAKRILIVLTLGTLSASAFFIRWENFKHSEKRSIDEFVYYTLGRQVNDDIADYNTIPYANKLMAQGRPLPEYFTQPLFKHPPLFTWLIAFSMQLFGVNIASAGYVSLFLGVLMIPLIYCLGSLVAGPLVGMGAAIFLWLDPVNIICSQKVWMDTPIAFFTLLAAVLFISGIKSRNDVLIIFSGIVSGCAANTKYTGILITVAFALYAFLYRKDLYRSRAFLFSLILPALMLVPWILWNIGVYGSHALGVQSILHVEIASKINLLKERWPLLLALILFTTAIILLLRKIARDSQAHQLSPRYRSLIKIGFLTFLVFLVSGQIRHSLQFGFIPSHSWMMGLFADQPPWFYIGRLIEYSLIYLFAFFALLFPRPRESKEMPFIRLTAGLILVFFIAWGNYQSRYILSAIPFLLILGVNVWKDLYERALQEETLSKRILWKILLYGMLIYTVFRTLNINMLMSYLNDFCYF
jgi:4-amino-4-deoxy-L-arabinose transferase-like glycosyltransferase